MSINKFVKTPEQIEGVRAACRLTSSVFDSLKENNIVEVGVTTKQIDNYITNIILDNRGTPACLGHKGYKFASCISINDEVCHGVPSDRQLKDGDLVKVDFAVELFGYYGDKAETFIVGKPSLRTSNIDRITKSAMMAGIYAIKPGARTGDVGYAIERYARQLGYTVVYDYAGHGVGLSLHELPLIPFFGKPGTGDLLLEGMIITVEPMLCERSPKLKISDDKWTAKTVDGGLSAQWENTVLVTKGGYEILT